MLCEAVDIWQNLPDEPLIQFALAELYSFTDRFADARRFIRILLNSKITEVGGISIEERLGMALSMGRQVMILAHLETALKTTRAMSFVSHGIRLLAIKETNKRLLLAKTSGVKHHQSTHLYLAWPLQEDEQPGKKPMKIEEGSMKIPSS